MRVAGLLFLASAAAAYGSSGLSSLLIPLSELQADANAVEVSIEKPVRAGPEAPPPPLKVTSADILPELERQLVRHYGLDGRLKLTMLQNWKGISVPDESWQVELVRLPSQGLSPRMVLPVRISCGKVETSAQLVVSCKLLREVYVPRRQINRGEPLVASDFEVQTRDILDTPAPIVPATELLSDYELNGSLAPGLPLLWRDIEAKPLVRKGQVVEMVASEGFMRISIKAQALENGRMGDFISVRNLTTRKDIQARILDEQTVQVLF